MHSIKIGPRELSATRPCYIIAEIGVNHNGDIDLAHKLIDVSKASGADAVKFQTFDTDALVRGNTPKADYQKTTTGDGTQNEMLTKLELSLDDFSALKTHCDELKIDFISTAFDDKSLDAVAALEPKCFKWPSGELLNIPLLTRAAQFKKPLLISTGMATLGEVSIAIEAVRSTGLEEIIVLQCVSDYPARTEDQNLRTLPVMSEAFGVPVGFSDHTLGADAAIAARSLGACIIEKHITLDCTMDGPDHKASMEPELFSDMVQRIRIIEVGLGDGIKKPAAAEENTKRVARKSLVYRDRLRAGHVISQNDLVAKRPNDGLSPHLVDDLIGRVLACDVEADQKAELSHLV